MGEGQNKTENIQNKKEDTHQSPLAAKMGGLGARVPTASICERETASTKIKPCDAMTSPPHRTTIIISPVAAMAVRRLGS